MSEVGERSVCNRQSQLSEGEKGVEREWVRWGVGA